MKPTHAYTAPHRRLLPCMAWAALLGCAGCAAPGKSGSPAATHSDRLMLAYPELKAGRFATLADFEDPAHLEIFQLINTSGQAACTIQPKSGRKETGGHGLVFAAGNEADALVIGKTDTPNWYLKRDWRPYDLLLLCVRAPRSDLSAELTIGARKPDDRLVVQSDIPLQRGWNLLRLDVAEIGDRLPLDDIRELRFRVTGADESVEVVIDDMLLTAHRQELMGDPKGPEGGLFVQQVGRRWKVGAVGRFEITFEHGQIVEWYNLGADPHRLGNLAAGTVLGPRPIVVLSDDPQEASGPADFRPLGRIVLAKQAIEEMSAVRVVVSCEWRFVDDPEGDHSARPLHRSVYTIYPSGDLYVLTECTARTPEWTPKQLGLAVSLSNKYPYLLDIHPVAQLSDPEPLRHVVYASATGPSAGGALLFFCPADSQKTPRIIQSVVAPPQGRISFVALGPPAEADVQTWRSLVTLLPAEKLGEADVRARALAYADPPPLTVQVGRLDDDSDAGRPGGFDQETGCYVLTAEDGMVRLTLDAVRHTFVSPALCIEGSAGQQAWVYVDNVLFDRTARDAQGRLIFQIPGRVRRTTTIEVLLRAE